MGKLYYGKAILWLYAIKQRRNGEKDVRRDDDFGKRCEQEL